MPTKIYDLPATTSLRGTDVFPVAIDAASTTRKISWDIISAALSGFPPLVRPPPTVSDFMQSLHGTVVGAFNTTSLLGNDVTHYFPFCVPKAVGVNNIFLRGQGGGAGTIDVGLYAADGANYLPSTRLYYAAGVTSNSSGVRTNLPIAAVLEPGMYYFAASRITGATTLMAPSSGSHMRGGMANFSAPGDFVFYVLTVAGASTLTNPATAPTAYRVTVPPAVFVDFL